MAAKAYAIVIGAVLTTRGSSVSSSEARGMEMMGMALQFTMVHNLIHLVSGLVGQARGF